MPFLLSKIDSDKPDAVKRKVPSGHFKSAQMGILFKFVLIYANFMGLFQISRWQFAKWILLEFKPVVFYIGVVC